ncbi:ABC transporter ATP-binding protein [Curtobacterium pusillum]|uniref:ABC-type quaternary amine transporter n=1 Tax=Curtobacterium pusillum TaxID=69373 RepID=A0AAW3T0M5_9MICO|nr:ABC transporter ATP-binding protein [Curtobacterium pusillum]MBA8988986.1 putative spermidine/putrescine transport system ATP-binding protein [Curtobacterium pusillum]NUU14115.1 ABC transporter ATP-binding protein [Curtobacterium pusillum]GLK32259.1 ABC transporter ATP-binding protein [Curtobacterium pusillum]
MTVTAPAAPASLATAGATVELEAVEKHYGAHRALAGLSLRVEPGEFVSLLGPSGCGKTTALRALAGLEGIDSGSIRIDGADVASTPVDKRDIGMVFQQYSLFPHMTVRQNVAFGLEMRRVPAASRRERVIDALDMVHLAEFADRYPHQLSGGQQQRVALARALVTRPRVLLLDEPLSALDAKVRVSLRDEIRRIQSDLGITTVFVTHDQEEALAVSDRIAVMNAGDIEQIGTPEELYRSPSSAFTADFVGQSNRLRGDLRGGDVFVYGFRVPAIDAGAQDGPVLAYVRPEDVAFAAEGVTGTVVASSFLGSIRRTTVRLDDDTVVTVQHEVGDRRAAGDAVAVRLLGAPVAVAPLA